jgi:hypothetical protein
VVGATLYTTEMAGIEATEYMEMVKFHYTEMAKATLYRDWCYYNIQRWLELQFSIQRYMKLYYAEMAGAALYRVGWSYSIQRKLLLQQYTEPAGVTVNRDSWIATIQHTEMVGATVYKCDWSYGIQSWLELRYTKMIGATVYKDD